MCSTSKIAVAGRCHAIMEFSSRLRLPIWLLLEQIEFPFLRFTSDIKGGNGITDPLGCTALSLSVCYQLVQNSNIVNTTTNYIRPPGFSICAATSNAITYQIVCFPAYTQCYSTLISFFLYQILEILNLVVIQVIYRLILV